MKILSVLLLVTTSHAAHATAPVVARYQDAAHFQHVAKQLSHKWGIRVVEHDPSEFKELAGSNGQYDRMTSTIDLTKGRTGNARFLTLLHEATHMTTDRKLRRAPSPQHAAPAIQIHLLKGPAKGEALIHPALALAYGSSLQIDEMKTFRKAFQVSAQLLENGQALGNYSLEDTDRRRLQYLDVSDRVARATEAVLGDAESWIGTGYLNDPASFSLGDYAPGAPNLRLYVFNIQTATGAHVQIQVPIDASLPPQDQAGAVLATVREGIKLARYYRAP